jgi:hypothetical protein
MTFPQFVFRTIVQPSVLLFCVCVVCGCSAAEHSANDRIEASKSDYDTLQVDATVNLRSGDNIRILRTDSSNVEGIYKAFVPLDSSMYVERYAKFLESANKSVAFPQLGDTLLLYMKTSKVPRRLMFLGYGTGTLRFTVRTFNEPTITTVAFTDLTALQNRDGLNIDLVMLERMSNAGQLPRDVSLIIETKQVTLRVPLDDIRYVLRSNVRSDMVARVAVGSVGAVILIVVLVSALAGALAALGPHAL